MDKEKPKSIQKIERRMEELDADSMRYHVLETAKRFKISWIELGQSLGEVWKDKLYRNWGYADFEAYAKKEIGIREQTAMKLVRSYNFLAAESPRHINKEHREEAKPAAVPTYEAVDVLRRASRNKNVDEEDYKVIRKKVLEDGRDAKEITSEIKRIVERNEELEPEGSRAKKKLSRLKRFVSILRSVRKEIRQEKILSQKVTKEAGELIDKLEEAILLEME